MRNCTSRGREKLALSRARNPLVKMHQTFRDQPKPVSELIDYLYSGRGEEMLSTVRLAKLLCEDEEKRQKIADLFTCIGHNRGA